MQENDPNFQIAVLALTTLKRNRGIATQDILSELKHVLDQESETYPLPVTIFHPDLSVLEAVCKYLADVYHLPPRKIAQLLDRETAVVSASIAKANKKIKQELKKQEHHITIPTSAFSASMGPLESITLFLKNNYHVSLSEIGRLLGRDPRNIWQSVNNAKKKVGALQ